MRTVFLMAAFYAVLCCILFWRNELMYLVFTCSPDWFLELLWRAGVLSLFEALSILQGMDAETALSLILKSVMFMTIRYLEGLVRFFGLLV